MPKPANLNVCPQCATHNPSHYNACSTCGWEFGFSNHSQEVGVCVYCLRFTHGPMRECKTQSNGKDYGHDYNYDPEYVALTRDYLEAVHVLWGADA